MDSQNAVTGSGIHGAAHGGYYPIAGSTVTLWYPGVTGYGSAPTALASTTTNSSGVFSFASTSYTCPAADMPVYLTITGGNPGLGSTLNWTTGTNTYLALMGYIGPCSSAGSQTNLVINEATTIATVFAVSQFSSAAQAAQGSNGVGASSIGSVSGTTAFNGGNFGAPVGTVSSGGILTVTNTLSYAGLKNAFATAANLANVNTGQAGATANANATPSTAKLNTLANILASCVQTDGVASDSALCSNLASATPTGVTPAGLNVPTDTVQIATYMALSPMNNVSTVFSNFTAPQSVFQAALSTAPFDWTLSVNYTGLGLNYPDDLAVDGKGQLWVVGNSGSMGLAGISPTGVSLSGGSAYLTTSTPFSNPTTVLVDNSGYIWVSNRTQAANDLVEFNPATPTTDTTYIANAQGTTGCGPGGLTLDPHLDLVFDCLLVSSPKYPLNAFQNTTTSTSSPIYSATSATFSNPATSSAATIGAYALHSDASGNIWLPDYASTCAANEMVPSGFTGSPALPTSYALTSSYPGTGTSGQDIAIDNAGNIWFDCSGNYLNELPAGTSSTVAFSGGGLSSPHFMSIDGAGDIWVANSSSVTVNSTTYSTVSEFNNAGTAITPATSSSNPGGFVVNTGTAVARYLAIDGSGNVWVPDSVASATQIAELVGVAVPVFTPLGTAPLNSKLGALPGATNGSSPDFSIAVDPQSVTAPYSSTTSTNELFNIYVSAIDGFSHNVTVTVSGSLPTGVSLPNGSSYTVTPGIPTQVTVTAAAGTAAALTPLTITGTYGTLSHHAQLELTTGTQPDYSLTASAGTIDLVANSSQSITLTATASNGFTGTAISAQINGLPSGVTTSPVSPFTLIPGVAKTITFTSGSSVSSGNTLLTAASTYGNTSHNTPILLNVGTQTQDFVLTTPAALNLNSSGTTTMTVYALGVGGFGNNVTVLISGLPSGVTASPSSFTLKLDPGSLANSTPPNSTTVTLTGSSSIASSTTSFNVIATSGSNLSHTNAVVLSTNPGTTETATINPLIAVGTAFPAYYVGVPVLTEFTGTGSSTNLGFVNLLKNLSPYIGSPTMRATLSTSNVSELAALVTSATFTNAGVTTSPKFYLLNYYPYIPSTYASDVQNVESAVGASNVLGYELDNEPDLYVSQSYRPSTWTFADYLRESAGYQQAFAPYISTPGLVAMATSEWGTDWDVNIPALLAQEGSQLAAFTAHQYGGTQSMTLAQLMADSASHIYYGRFAPLVKTLGSIPVRVGEMNTIGDLGKAGISNTPAASLWLVDALFEAKSAGVAGVDVHSGGVVGAPDVYDMAYLDGTGLTTVYPPYYGILFFSEAIQNGAKPIQVTYTQSSGNIKIWATIDKSNVVRVVVIEKDTDGTSNSHTVSLNLGSAYTAAGSLTTLTDASGLTDTTYNIYIGGQTFSGTTNGLLTGTASSSTITPTSGVYTLTVQDGSAALLTIP
jgi:hypothetical protein